MIWKDIEKIRAEAPLIHNITNYVVMNNTANALLAIGASPVMAHAQEEVEELVAMSKALVINIGTLSKPWIESMIRAGIEAHKLNIPIVLDPVGSGATKFRTQTVLKLIEEIHPTVIRGNSSEIKSLINSETRTKGVDSLLSSDMVIKEAKLLSKALNCVISISGANDLIICNDSIAKVSNGHEMMTKVTGLGCTASAITGAFLAVNNSVFNACTNAMILMGIAGELALKVSNGPGSLQMNFIDTLYNITQKDIETKEKVQLGFLHENNTLKLEKFEH